jgi:ABC-2 type transport system permease protein
MNWRAVWAIARKDIVDAARNHYILAVLTLPVFLSVLFPLIVPNTETDAPALAIVVHDPGNSNLVAWLQAMPGMQLTEVDSGDQVPERVVADTAMAGIVLPIGFDSDVAAGARPELTVYLNQERSAFWETALRQLIGQEVVRHLVAGQVAVLTEGPPPVQIVWANVGTAPAQQAPGGLGLDPLLLVIILVMVLVMAGGYAVPLLVVEEKEKRTLAFLLVSPAGAGEVVLGKALTGLFYSLAVAAIAVALNEGWIGNWPITFLTLFLGMLFTIAVGLLMGGFFDDTVQVNTWGSIVVMGLLAPSWVAFGSQLPTWVAVALRLVPTYYLVDALNLSVADQGNLAQIARDLAVLGGSTVLAFAAVVWSVRREAS